MVNIKSRQLRAQQCTVTAKVLLKFYWQKQQPRGVPRKKCSENMQQYYRRTPMPKCDFNKVALHSLANFRKVV